MGWWSLTEQAPKTNNRGTKSHRKDTTRTVSKRKTRRPEIVEERRGGYEEVDRRGRSHSRTLPPAPGQYHDNNLTNKKNSGHQRHRRGGQHRGIPNESRGGAFQDGRRNHQGRERSRSVSRGRTSYREGFIPSQPNTGQYVNDSPQRYEGASRVQNSNEPRPYKVQEARSSYPPTQPNAPYTLPSQPRKATVFNNSARPNPGRQSKILEPLGFAIANGLLGKGLPTKEEFARLSGSQHRAVPQQPQPCYTSPQPQQQHQNFQYRQPQNQPLHTKYQTEVREPGTSMPPPSTNVGVAPDECLYKTLGVARDADINEIRRAYKKLKFDIHPDRDRNNPRATENFTKLNVAHENLIDPRARSWYDRTGTLMPTRMGD